MEVKPSKVDKVEDNVFASDKERLEDEDFSEE